MIHALTVQQPFADAIKRAAASELGPLVGKTLENRKWAPPPTLIGRPFVIHAGVAEASVNDVLAVGTLLFGDPTTEAACAAWRKYEADLAAGAGKLLCVVTLAAVTKAAPVLLPKHQARWRIYDIRFGWVLADVRPLPRPIIQRGQQGLWQLSDDTERELRAQVAL